MNKKFDLKQLIKSRRSVLRQVGLVRHEIELINEEKLGEVFSLAAVDFLNDPEVLNNIVIGLAARLERDYGAEQSEIMFEFDRLGHPGDHNLSAVLLLLDMINGYEDARAENYQEQRQQWRESEARI